MSVVSTSAHAPVYVIQGEVSGTKERRVSKTQDRQSTQYGVGTCCDVQVRLVIGMVVSKGASQRQESVGDDGRPSEGGRRERGRTRIEAAGRLTYTGVPWHSHDIGASKS
jgi:hypothetical protein